MAINKKLIHFNKKSDFESEVAKGNILNYSICFIADTKEIYTHGNYYSQVSEAPTDGQKYIRVDGAWYVLSDSSSSTSGLMSAIDKTKLDRIAAGAQVNVIESVKVNGTAQAISNKEINIPVPTRLSQLTNNIYEVATSAEITAILN